MEGICPQGAEFQTFGDPSGVGKDRDCHLPQAPRSDYSSASPDPGSPASSAGLPSVWPLLPASTCNLCWGG